MMKKAIGQMEELLRFMFDHVINLPAQSIEQVTLLVSYTQQTEYVFKNLQGLTKSGRKYDLPMLLQLQENIKVIHPSQAMLSPEIKYNFFTVNYLFNTIKRIKILFVFSHNDVIASNMKNVKQTFTRLESIFKKYDGLGKSLGLSSGIIITYPNMSIESYSQNFLKILKQTGFIKSQTIKDLINEMIAQKKILLFKQQAVNKPLFTQFVKDIDYFDIQDKVDIKLNSSILDFREYLVSSLWQKKFVEFFENMMNLMKEKTDQESMPIKKQYFKLMDINAIKEVPKQTKENITQEKSFLSMNMLLIALQTLQCVLETEQMTLQNSKRLILTLLQKLYNSNCLEHYILFFYKAYFQIYRVLQDKKYTYPKTDETKLPSLELITLASVTQSPSFLKINFIESTFRHKQKMNSLLRNLLEVVVENVENEIKRKDPKYHFTEAITWLENIHNIMITLKELSQTKMGVGQNNLSFWTVRMEKKIIKFISELQYLKVITISKRPGRSYQECRMSWITFLIRSQKSTVKNTDSIKEGIHFLANQLTKEKCYEEAIELFNLLPEHEAYSQIISIYSTKFKLHPDFLKYTLLDDFEKNIQHLQRYCTFLTRIGFNQRVRQICYQGLKFAMEKQRPGATELFKRLLIKARPQNGDKHNSYLQQSILKEKEIGLTQELLKRIQEKFKKLSKK